MPGYLLHMKCQWCKFWVFPDFIPSADVVKDKSHVMYEGKHIHFSEVDNKPLCSYSPKLCKQRRLNGYAFCIRHVLEDKTAPFKQCEYVAKYNSQRCTNPIPKSEDRRCVCLCAHVAYSTMLCGKHVTDVQSMLKMCFCFPDTVTATCRFWDLSPRRNVRRSMMLWRKCALGRTWSQWLST